MRRCFAVAAGDDGAGETVMFAVAAGDFFEGLVPHRAAVPAASRRRMDNRFMVVAAF